MTHWEKSKQYFLANGVWEGVSHPIAIARKFRRWLLETRPNRCSMCMTTEWLGNPIPLVMDHVDGESTNWALGNLRLICCNCDATLPTFKNRNKGKGRGYRRERYKEGKTF